MLSYGKMPWQVKRAPLAVQSNAMTSPATDTTDMHIGHRLHTMVRTLLAEMRLTERELSKRRCFEGGALGVKLTQRCTLTSRTAFS